MFYEPPQKWTEVLVDELPFGEDDRYERKSGAEITKNKLDDFFNKLAKEIGAFANSFGGTLFIGIDDDKKKVGIPATAKGSTPTERWLENKIPILFELRLQHFRVSRVELTDETQNQIGNDKIIIAIDVFDSELSPHQCLFDHKYYYRVNSESRPAPHHYLAFLWGRANSNMSQVATWWLNDFLSPVLTVLGKAERDFKQNTFPLVEFGTGVSYRVNFFNKAKWEELITSNVGEYFLHSFPLIERELTSFEKTIDGYDKSLTELEKTVEASPVLLKELKDIYERLIRREHIPRSQFEHYNLQEITRYMLGQLRLQISHFPVEAKGNLVRLTAYSLLEININVEVHVQSETGQLLSLCKDIANQLKANDSSLSKPLQESTLFLRKVKNEVSDLLGRLRKYRIDIAKRYTATFEQ